MTDAYSELLARAATLGHRGEYAAATRFAQEATKSPSPIQRQAALLKLREINRLQGNYCSPADPRAFLGSVPLTPDLHFTWSYGSLKIARYAWNKPRCRDLLEFLWCLAEMTAVPTLRIQALIEMGLHARQWPEEKQEFVQRLVPDFDSQLDRHGESTADERLYFKAVHGRGYLDSSPDMIEQCRNGFSRIKDRLGVADTLWTGAEVHAKQGNQRNVRNYLEQARTLLDDLGLAHDAQRTEWLLKLYDSIGIFFHGFIGRNAIDTDCEVCEINIDPKELPYWLAHPAVLPIGAAVTGGTARSIAKTKLQSAPFHIAAESRFFKDLDLVSEVLEFETKQQIKEQLRRVGLHITLDLQRVRYRDFFKSRDFKCNEILIMHGPAGYRLLATEDALRDLRVGIARLTDPISSLSYLPSRIIARGLRHFAQEKVDELVLGDNYNLRKVQRYLIVLLKEFQKDPYSRRRFIDKCKQMGFLEDDEVQKLRSRFPVFSMLVKWLPVNAACFLADLQDKKSWAWRFRWLRRRV